MKHADEAWRKRHPIEARLDDVCEYWFGCDFQFALGIVFILVGGAMIGVTLYTWSPGSILFSFLVIAGVMMVREDARRDRHEPPENGVGARSKLDIQWPNDHTATNMSDTSAVSGDEDPFAMANLPPRLTRLPMVVWASERMGARHDVRVKVHMAHGQRIDPGNLAVVAVRPAPRLIAGHLSPADLRAVSDWITLNEAVLVDYWDGRIYTDELIQRLQRLP